MHLRSRASKLECTVHGCYVLEWIGTISYSDANKSDVNTVAISWIIELAYGTQSTAGS